jgi:hypothetical protein
MAKVLPLFVLALAGAALAGAVQAHPHSRKGDHQLSCDVESQYTVRPYKGAYVFARDGREVGIGGGRLFVDGREVEVSAADHARLVEMEQEFRALQPEMQQVVSEAVDIAFTALTEVARGLSGDPGQTMAELEASHRQARARMAAAPLALFNEDAMAGIVEPIMREHVPEIVGGAVRTAIKAAFSTGKEAGELKARMDRMEHELDARVDARAEALEPLAQSMCSRLRRMDALDDALEVRTADGKRFDLLEADTRKDE